MENRTLVIGGLGVVAVVVILYFLRDGSSSGGTPSTLGAAPSSDGPSGSELLSARAGAFGTLAGIVNNITQSASDAATALSLANIQAALEQTRIDAASNAQLLQAQTQQQAIKSQAGTAKTEAWLNAGSSVVNSVFGYLGSRNRGGSSGPRYGGNGSPGGYLAYQPARFGGAPGY